MSIFNKVLTQPELIQEPPVLVDIGASGKIHPFWKAIAPYSICIAFDADARDFNADESDNKGYKKLHLFNKIVSTDSKDKTFYLTRSPHCSSVLKPDTRSLDQWAYSKKFEIEKTVKLKSVDLPTVLQNLNLQKIDWFKSDSQGIDLKLFKSLPVYTQNKVLIAEFEPGILNAYEGEDKLHHVLSFMETNTNFWLSKLEIKGTQRIGYQNLHDILKNDLLTEASPYIHKSAPGWGEMVFINTFENLKSSKRDLLLGWVLASIQQEHGFAYQVAKTGFENFPDPLFKSLMSHAAMKIRLGMISLKYFPLIFRKSSQVLQRLAALSII